MAQMGFLISSKPGERRRALLPEQVRQTSVQTTAQLTGADNAKLEPVSPGGFAWQPAVGEQLLVYQNLAIGSMKQCPVTLAPGECCLFTPTAYIHLTADGGIRLHGSVQVNGSPIGSGI